MFKRGNLVGCIPVEDVAVVGAEKRAAELDELVDEFRLLQLAEIDRRERTSEIYAGLQVVDHAEPAAGGIPLGVLGLDRLESRHIAPVGPHEGGNRLLVEMGTIRGADLGVAIQVEIVRAREVEEQHVHPASRIATPIVRAVVDLLGVAE